MSQSILVDLDMPADLEQFKLPEAVNERLQFLLDKQEQGQNLSQSERQEAEGLVDLADLLSLLKLRARKASQASSN